MTNSLDIDHLRTLVAIAECGGFSRAAAVRHISQPALSQHVRLLERGLKRKLFEKDGRVMRFTRDGEAVLAEARQILAVHDQAMERLTVEQTRTIVVGCTEHAAEQVLPEMLRVLSTAFPGATTRFEIGRSTALSDAVAKGTLDLAFVLDPGSAGAGHEVARLPLTWYAAPSWTPPEAGEPWPLVAFEEPCGLRERALVALDGEGHRVQVTAQSSTLEGVTAGVRAGIGVALLPSSGGLPHGLVVRDDLPETGETSLRMVVRRGLEPDVELAAAEAVARFFSTRPRLRLVTEGFALAARTTSGA
ncbi:LysR family transcriptional regulator [Nocardioides flavescens]|uniref:LysR family transcriptional regulator n=1 Tax=Nocardioides flavescens TaxID=2691959 RepID=A0A6L7F1S2_9ACTN|nr:LysR family transcriptional regulator [Nocardioides flavescens]MXG90911.1 LysR family transcriptional regulator [Nocardioides flavescens]